MFRFFISWPAKVKPTVYDKPAIQLDIHATALAAAGIDAKTVPTLEGVDLVPYLSGTKSGSPHEALFWRFGDQMAVRAGNWKLVKYDTNVDTQTGRGQAVTDAKLYNLVDDIHEEHDLASSNPAKVKELQAQWDAWNQSNVTPLWGKGGDGEKRQKGTEKKKRKKAEAVDDQ